MWYWHPLNGVGHTTLSSSQNVAITDAKNLWAEVDHKVMKMGLKEIGAIVGGQ